MPDPIDRDLIRRGDFIRPNTWTKCYLFVTQVCEKGCHVKGIIYEPQECGAPPFVRDRRAEFPIDNTWSYYHAPPRALPKE